MEEKDLELYLKKAKVQDVAITSFSEAIGNAPVAWQKGDIISFPATIKYNSFKRKFNGRMLEYIVVKVTSVDGTTRYGNFFPSLFRKRARKCDWETVDGVDIAIPQQGPDAFVVAGGSIVEKIYKKNAKVNDVVTAVLGKAIRIEEVHEVESLKFGTINEQDIIKVYDFEPEGWTIGSAPEDVPADTPEDAIKEIENTYGNLIDEGLKNRDYSMPVLAIGLPFSVFGNRMVLKFVKSSDEDDIEYRFYYHYSGFCLDVLSKDNTSIRKIIIRIIYNHFYESRFKNK